MGCISSKNIKLLEESPFESFEDRYQMGTQKLGRGVYGTVWECFEKKSGKKCAVKVVERSKLNNREDAFVLNEVKLLRRIKHPHIVRLYHVYTTHMSYHIVMEICEGGELLERIVRKGDNGQRYTEREARSVVRILLEALCYCHSKKIVHRDVKPENLLLDTPGDDAKVKLTDFGLAEMLNHPNDTLKMQCGTPCYMAPELLKGEPYSYPVDLWSAGIVTFVLLGGYHPFLYGDNKDLHRRIMTGQALLQPEKWKNVSKDAKDMVLQMLCIDPNTRLTAAQALKHAWMKVDDSALENNTLCATVDELRGFNARRRFRAAADVVMLKNYLTRNCYLKKVVSTDDVHEVVAMSRCALRIEEDLQEELKEAEEDDEYEQQRGSDLDDSRGVMF